MFVVAAVMNLLLLLLMMTLVMSLAIMLVGNADVAEITVLFCAQSCWHTADVMFILVDVDLDNIFVPVLYLSVVDFVMAAFGKTMGNVFHVFEILLLNMLRYC